MVAEKGADLVKELWLQEDVVRAERAADAEKAKVNDLANVTLVWASGHVMHHIDWLVITEL